jgi:hypothetical protein
MPYTLVAFYEDAGSTSFAALPPVPDEHIVYYSDSIRVPELNKLLAVWVYGSDIAQARLVSPSLRSQWLEDLDVFLQGDSLPSVQAVNEAGSGQYKVELDYALKDYGASPLELTTGERFSIEVKQATGNTPIWAVCVFGDAVPTPVAGKIRTIRGTLSGSGSAGTWGTFTVSLGQALEVGTYDVVGAKCPTSGTLACRFIATGQWWRAGVLSQTGLSVPLPRKFEVGNMGTLCSFTNETIPQVELLCTGSVSSGTVYLNLIKR